MKLQTKISIINISIIFFLIIIVSISSYYIFIHSFINLEDKNIYENTARFEEIKQKEIETITSSVKDWGKWTDTYDFVNNNNSGFPLNNLNNEVLQNLGIEFIILINNSKDLFYDYFTDSITADKQETVENLFKSEAKTWNKENQGYLNYSDSIIIFSSSEILRSDHTGEPGSYLVFGYFIDKKILSNNKKQIKFPVEIILAKDISPEILNCKEIKYIIKKEKEYIKAYTPLINLNNQKVAFFEITMPREIYYQGKYTLYLLYTSLWLLFFIFIILTIIFNYFLSKKITSPLADLKKITQEIDKGNLDLKLNIDKKSEVITLADSIKRLVDKLKNDQKSLEEKVKERTSQLESKNNELENLNKTFINREIKMTELKEEIKKLKGGNKKD